MSLIKDLDFYCLLLIFLVNMLGLLLWKIKKGASIVDAFQKILGKSTELHSERKPNKIWVDKGS